MSLYARIKLYLSKIFRDNPNGLSLDDIIEKTAKLENLEIDILDLSKNSNRNPILGIILDGMACQEKPIKEQHYLEIKNDVSYSSNETFNNWKFNNSKYYQNKIEILDQDEIKIINDIKLHGLERYEHNFTSLILKQIFSENKNKGLTYNKLLEEFKKYYKFTHDDYSGNIEQFMSLIPELSLIIAMNFPIRPTLERYYLDKIDLKSYKKSETWINWIYINKKYYLFEREELTDEIINANLRQSVMNILAEQLGKNASKNNLTNFEYLREFASAMANIEKLGIDEKYLEYLKES